jgi:hypothetical protein
MDGVVSAGQLAVPELGTHPLTCLVYELLPAERRQQPGYRPDAPPAPEHDSAGGPEDDAFDRLWDRFEGEPYEDQVALFLQTLDNASLPSIIGPPIQKSIRSGLPQQFSL